MRGLCRTIVLVLLALNLAACGSQEHSHDGAGGGSPEAADERPTIAVTQWTERSELFMEYPVLVAGESSRFAIHVTELAGFTPLTAGEAIVVLRGQDGAEQEFPGGISRPGIFGVDVVPTGTGRFEMTLKIDAPDMEDLHALGSVTVHNAGAAIAAVAGEEGEAISFLKEQQWTLEFATDVVAVRSLQTSFEVPGIVRPRGGGDAVLSAPVSGRIDLSSAVPVPGERTAAGSVLARIIPRASEIRDVAGLRADLVEAEQQHELARQERDRATRLVESRALPARRLSEAEAAVATSRARLAAARQRLQRLDALSRPGDPDGSDDWLVVRAPFAGLVAQVEFASGASVEEGDALLRLVDTERVHIVGAVPESRASVLRTVGTAELLLPERAPVLLGRAVAMGDVVKPATRTVDIRYEMDNREIHLPMGQGVRLRLFVGVEEALPSVPEAAIIDDGGRPVVFVQAGGESFQRRPVRLGSRQDGYVHVLEGIEPDERVVSVGAYLIRLAAMSTQIPAHGHVH